MDPHRLRNGSPDRLARIKARVRILKDHLQLRPERLHGRMRKRGQFGIIEGDRLRCSARSAVRIDRPMVDLPHPDSPTSARVSPAARSNETFSTAWTRAFTRPSTPPEMGKRVVRLRARSKGCPALGCRIGISGSMTAPVCRSTISNLHGRVCLAHRSQAWDGAHQGAGVVRFRRCEYPSGRPLLNSSCRAT